MTSLHHENVATFHGVCVSQQEFVMVNEYCIKGSLEVGDKINAHQAGHTCHNITPDP